MKTKLQIISSKTSKQFHPKYGHLYFTNDIDSMMDEYSNQEKNILQSSVSKLEDMNDKLSDDCTNILCVKQKLEDQNNIYKRVMEEVIKRGSPIDSQKECGIIKMMIREALNKEEQ